MHGAVLAVNPMRRNMAWPAPETRADGHAGGNGWACQPVCAPLAKGFDVRPRCRPNVPSMNRNAALASTTAAKMLGRGMQAVGTCLAACLFVALCSSVEGVSGAAQYPIRVPVAFGS
jgi:hypothetical protein